MKLLWRKKPPPRPQLELELGLVTVNSRVWLNGQDISRWVTGVSVEANVGEVVAVELRVLPDKVRIRVPRLPPRSFVATGEDGVTREVKL